MLDAGEEYEEGFFLPERKDDTEDVAEDTESSRTRPVLSDEGPAFGALGSGGATCLLALAGISASDFWGLIARFLDAAEEFGAGKAEDRPGSSRA